MKPQNILFLLSSRDVLLQPGGDLLLVPAEPLDVVPDRLQSLLAGHLPRSCVRGQAEEVLHLKEENESQSGSVEEATEGEERQDRRPDLPQLQLAVVGGGDLRQQAAQVPVVDGVPVRAEADGEIMQKKTHL